MILIDANNIAYMAYHSLGELADGEILTGTVFGFLNMVNSIAQRHGTAMVFCFDSKKNIRKRVLPSYKGTRHKDLTEEKLIELHHMHRQLTQIRREILPQMGFKNIKIKSGYEADDLIAYYALKYYKRKTIIVSTDKDLYQLLGRKVSIYNPKTKKEFTVDDFRRAYGISPKEWSRVKSIAGDSSDNIKGIAGVGEKTALKYIKGILPTTTKAYENIKVNQKEINLNMRLINLPYLGGRELKFVYKKNRLSRKKFISTFDKLRFIHFLKEENFERWERNFRIKPSRSM